MTKQISDRGTLQVPSLQTKWLGRSWHYFPEISSTNIWLKERVATLPHGAVAITNHQTAGKGRHGRSWVTPPDTAILHSLLLKPDWPIDQAPWLTMIAGLAAVKAISQISAIPVQLKWPNDVVVTQPDGTWRKLGGILLDGHVESEKLSYAIVGIGLNINLQTSDLPTAVTPATSVLIESGRPASRLAILAQLLLEFEQLYERSGQGVSPHLAWERKLVTLNKMVTITHLHQKKNQLQGVAVGTNRWGHLLVQDKKGDIHEIAAGDVTLR